jgi:hypothetical protein
MHTIFPVWYKGYYGTEFVPVCVSFIQVQSNVIHSVEQKVSRKVKIFYFIEFQCME